MMGAIAIFENLQEWQLPTFLFDRMSLYIQHSFMRA